MGPPWVMPAPVGPHVGPMNLAIWDPVLPTYVFPLIRWRFHMYLCNRNLYNWKEGLHIKMPPHSKSIYFAPVHESVHVPHWFLSMTCSSETPLGGIILRRGVNNPNFSVPLLFFRIIKSPTTVLKSLSCLADATAAYVAVVSVTY